MSSLQATRSDVKPEAAELLAARLREREFVAYGLPLNLQVLGFLQSGFDVAAVALLAIGWLLQMAGLLSKQAHLSLLGLTGILVGGHRILRQRYWWQWIGPDGSNRHRFVVRPEPVVWWKHLSVIHPNNPDVWTEFLLQPIVDPHLGELRCDFHSSDASAWRENEVVFRIQAKPQQIPKKVERNSLRTWKGERRVLADPLLHPDTIEALVERYVLSGNETAMRNYKINRHFEKSTR